MDLRYGVQVVLSSINNYPDTLSYSSELNELSNWSDNVETRLILQSYDCRHGHQNCLLIGNFSDNKEHYSGIKIGTRYGWVKLVNEVFGPLKIEEYALMK